MLSLKCQMGHGLAVHLAHCCSPHTLIAAAQQHSYLPLSEDWLCLEPWTASTSTCPQAWTAWLTFRCFSSSSTFRQFYLYKTNINSFFFFLLQVWNDAGSQIFFSPVWTWWPRNKSLVLTLWLNPTLKLTGSIPHRNCPKSVLICCPDKNMKKTLQFNIWEQRRRLVESSVCVL